MDSHALFAAPYFVPAARWMDTGIYVPAGGSVLVESRGMWNPWHGHTADMGPDGVQDSTNNDTNKDRVCVNANWGALIGRIGDGPYQKIGLQANLTTRTGGRLVMGMNDDFLSGGMKDNTGRLSVLVTCVGPNSPEERMPLNMVRTPEYVPAPRA